MHYLVGFKSITFPKCCRCMCTNNISFFFFLNFNLISVLPNWQSIFPKCCKVLSSLQFLFFSISTKQYYIHDYTLNMDEQSYCSFISTHLTILFCSFSCSLLFYSTLHINTKIFQHISNEDWNFLLWALDNCFRFS